MFGWLWRLFGGRDDGQAIFKFRDGGRWRHADPIEAWTRFEDACGGDPEALLRSVIAPPTPGAIGKLARMVERDRREKADKLAAGVCAALGVKPLADDGSGMTRRARLELAAEFVLYLSRLAAAARPFAGSPPGTA